MECFSRFVKSMDESVKHIYSTMERSAKKYEECKYGLHYLLILCILSHRSRFLLSSLIQLLIAANSVVFISINILFFVFLASFSAVTSS